MCTQSNVNADASDLDKPDGTNTRPRCVELFEESNNPRCKKSKMAKDKFKQARICENSSALAQTQSSADDNIPEHDRPVTEKTMSKCAELCDADSDPRCRRSGASSGMSKYAQL